MSERGILRRFRRRDWEEIARRLEGQGGTGRDQAQDIRWALEREDTDPLAVLTMPVLPLSLVDAVCTEIREVPR